MFAPSASFCVTSILALVYQIEAKVDSRCYMDVPSIIKSYGYPSETHFASTQDNYELEIHRIPQGISNCGSNQRPPVLLLPSLFTDSYLFVMNPPNESLAFILADAGLDVWLGNYRGSPSFEHYLPSGPASKGFWNFSYDEHAELDLPAMVDYILEQTGQDNLYYIGHSQGTIIMFAKLAEDPGFGSKIAQFHALAPATFPVELTEQLVDISEVALALPKSIFEYFEYSSIYVPDVITTAYGIMCSEQFIQPICEFGVSFFAGHSFHLNLTRLGSYLCHLPSSTSGKNLFHFAQGAVSSNFTKFDYGSEGNLIKYGQKEAPLYNISNIHDVNMFLYWSVDDTLTRGARELISLLNHTNLKVYEYQRYSHLDFVWDQNAAAEVYSHIIETIEGNENRKGMKIIC